jgi:succinate dehydrogenase / fumarate reductase cytochrome b subunit
VPRQFAYYPGCVAEFSSKELNATTKALAPLLDIELLPMPQATCCGAGDIAEAKPNLYLTLNVRILSEAEEMGADILTICNVCTLNLRRANKMVKEDPRLLEQVNGELVKAGARPYQGTIDVTHLLWYLATEEGLSLLEQRGPRGLNGLKVAPYYGCQLLRPSSVMGFEDPDRPQSLERLITALGGEVADYDGNVDIATGTLTLDFKPIPNSSNIIIRWDNRAEYSNQATYFDGAGDASQVWFTSVLGVVANTDGLF